MKVILEFDSNEVKEAEQSYKGPQYAMAVEDYRQYLRNLMKHEDYSEETGKYLSNAQQTFFDIFEGLLDE